MLDADLAEMYQVETRRLNEQVQIGEVEEKILMLLQNKVLPCFLVF